MSDELTTLRTKIDDIDQQIQDLITKRATCTKDIAQVKKQTGEETFYHRPEREAQILREVIKRNSGPLGDEAVVSIFRSIMSSSLALQQPTQVAFLGPEGTFSNAAALQHFGPSMLTAPQSSIKQVFQQVATGNVPYSVVAVENSTEGSVNLTLDLMMKYDLKICGEVVLPIHLHLLVNPKSKASIHRIYGHQQALAQTRDWLDANWPDAERIAVSSNGFAAQRASKEKGSAALAGDAAANIYGLTLHAKNIEDNPNNMTRFWVLGQQDIPPSGMDKTSLLITLPNQPGAFIELMSPLTKEQINLTFFEARPSGNQNWEYVYFVDVLGHKNDDALQRALSALDKSSIGIRVLGAYPKAV